MTRATPERSVQVTVLRWLRVVLPPGSIVAAIKNEEKAPSTDRFARARFQAARRATGTLPGIPDLMALMPAGRVVFLELKRPDGGEVSEYQQDMHRGMAAIGHTVVLATSIETARHGLQAAGVPLREAAGQATAAPVVRRVKPRPKLPHDKLPF